MAGILLNRSRQAPADETPAFGGIAERFRRAGDLDRAIALCRDGLKRFPDQLSARVTLGWSLLDKGQYEEARGELERVLRRAPDNLAAIRGLAELHDRSEGTLPTMEERESWRQEDQQAENARAAKAAQAEHEASARTVRQAAPETAAVDPFAPISITLASSTADEAFEVLHTAQHAEQAAAEAAGGFDPADLSVTPVQLEDAATASMAAASEPAPFFVSGTEAEYEAPEPFAADAAEVAEDFSVTAAASIDLVSLHEDTDLANGDAALEQFGAFSAAASADVSEAVIDLAPDLPTGLDPMGPADDGMPAGWDDPLADFNLVSGADNASSTEADAPLSLEWAAAGPSEEAVHADTDSLSLDLDHGPEAEELAAAMWSLEGEVPTAEAVVEPMAACEDIAAVEDDGGLASMLAAFEENTGAAPLAEPAIGFEMVEDLLEPVAVASVMIEPALPLQDAAAEVALVEAAEEINHFELVGPELASLESMSLDSDELEFVAFEVVEVDSCSLLLDYEAQPEADSHREPEAPAADGWSDSVEAVYQPAAAAIAEVWLPDSSPDVTAIAARVVAGVAIGPATSHARSALPGLERFLRQVQARRLELATESVA